MRQLQGIARKLVDENWERIETVAAALLEFGELRREEVEALVNRSTLADDELLDLIVGYRAGIGGDRNHVDRRVLSVLAGSVMTGMITGQWRAGRYASWVRTQSIAARAAISISLGMRPQEISVAGNDTSLVGRCRFESDYGVDPSHRRDGPDIGELRRDLPGLRERARDLVLADWYAIQGLAEALRQRTTLTGVEAEHILNERVAPWSRGEANTVGAYAPRARPPRAGRCSRA